MKWFKFPAAYLPICFSSNDASVCRALKDIDSNRTDLKANKKGEVKKVVSSTLEKNTDYILSIWDVQWRPIELRIFHRNESY